MAEPLMQRRFSDGDTAFTIRYFEQFYETISRMQSDIVTGKWTGGAREILTQLKDLLNRQSLECQQQGGFSGTYYEDAKFVMAALADEIFLKMDWDGRTFWEDNLLESQLFGTHDAGDLFFDRLDELLKTRDALQRDTAQIYLMALGLGFEGRYKGTLSSDVLRDYRKNLYILIHHHEPMLGGDGMRLCPDAYAHTLSSPGVKLLNDMRLWALVLGGVFGVLLIASAILWHKTTTGITHIIDGILVQSTGPNRP